MPMIDADGCLLNVSVEGRQAGPTLMLSNSLGTNMQMWEPQMKALTQVFRVIRYDRRGHGKSGVPAGPYSMERFGRDVLAILDDLNIDKVHWCGLSMGGMVGQWLGANAPERIGKIILANTACYYADPTNWFNRIKAVNEGGIAAVADAVIATWLSADFREREPQITANLKAMLLASPVQGYLACCEALSTLDQRELLPKIKSPTLVIAGRHDMATPIAAGELIRSKIPGASLTILDAAHISNVEQSHAFTDAVVGFLTQRVRPQERRHCAPKQSRIPVWSFGPSRNDGNRRHIKWTINSAATAAWSSAEKSSATPGSTNPIANRNAFNADFQDLITRYAWGEIWTRPHFDERTRRVLVIGTLVALGQWDEFRLHVRAALAEGGFTPDDIKEILLQQAIYCGVPAANHAVKEASAIVEELGLAKR